eukprot:3241289-Rhodomonas_salina.2
MAMCMCVWPAVLHKLALDAPLNVRLEKQSILVHNPPKSVTKRLLVRTDIVVRCYGATQCAVLRVWWHAMPDTDIGYVAVRCAVLREAMVVPGGVRPRIQGQGGLCYPPTL